VAWATVLAGGLIARELGGKRAQLLAAIGTATCRCCRGPVLRPARPPTSCWRGRP